MLPFAKDLVVITVILAVGACGDASTTNVTDAAPSNTNDAAAGVPDATPSADANPECAAAVSALSPELSGVGKVCTVTVRLDYQTKDVKGYQVFCGDSPAPAAAPATATTDTGYGTGDDMINESNPDDTYVFYRSPSDVGGVGAVNAQNGLSVFGGSIVRLGAGEITYPTIWRSADELASGCMPSGGIDVRRGWDLRSGDALLATDVDAAITGVLDTAVPAALWHNGYVFHATVLLYPRSVGPFDPTSAEWIVLVTGGWLE